jgi:hypothetical protein
LQASAIPSIGTHMMRITNMCVYSWT